MIYASLAAGLAVFWLIEELGRMGFIQGTSRLRELAGPVSSQVLSGKTGHGPGTTALSFLSRPLTVIRPGVEHRIQSRLVQAGMGDTMTPEIFLGWQMVFSLCGLTIGLILALLSEGRWAWIRPLAWTLLGFKAPEVWLVQRAEARRRKVLSDLPFFLDLLVVCAGAGLNLRRSLEALAGFRSGPLGSEIRRAVKEMEVGRSPAQALRSLADRTGLPQISAFASMIIQAEAMGTPVARVFAAQAEAARVQSRQRQEARIAVLPTRLTVITILLDLPAIFGLTVLPNVLKFISAGW